MTDVDDEMLPGSLPEDSSDNSIGDEASVHGNVDIPADGTARLVDLDGDGTPDAIAADIDLNGDGNSDIHELAIDANGDGTPDILIQADAAQDIWGALEAEVLSEPMEDTFNLLGATYSDFNFAGYDDLAATYGTPEYEMQFWDPQDEPNSCLIAVTSSMMNSMGIDMNEPILTDFLEQEGIYDPMEGTVPANMADVINRLAATTGTDVVAIPYYGKSDDDLEAMLEHGKIQVSVNAAKLPPSEPTDTLSDYGFNSYSPHAVQLIGIEDTSDGKVAIYNDPYWGPGMRCPLDIFDGARADLNDSGYLLTDSTNLASLTTGFDTGEPEIRLGGAGELLRVDINNYLHKGDSLLLIPKPGGGYLKLGDMT